MVVTKYVKLLILKVCRGKCLLYFMLFAQFQIYHACLCGTMQQVAFTSFDFSDLPTYFDHLSTNVCHQRKCLLCCFSQPQRHVNYSLKMYPLSCVDPIYTMIINHDNTPQFFVFQYQFFSIIYKNNSNHPSTQYIICWPSRVIVPIKKKLRESNEVHLTSISQKYIIANLFM